MRPETYDMVSAREERYWWHSARRELAVRLLCRYAGGTGQRVVDLGCGTGGNFAIFGRFAPRMVVGIDISPLALTHARRKQPSAALVRADVGRPLPFADRTIGLVTIFNVLYHQWVDDEVGVLSEVHRILEPGGVLLATEPAFRGLARQMDDAAMGRRRYRVPEFVAMCAAAKLEVRFASYFTSFGAAVVPPMKMLDRLGGSGGAQLDMQPLHPLLNRLLLAAARVEAAAIDRGLRMPFGLTLACIAVRPAR